MLDVSNRLKSLLEQTEMSVSMTRTTDIFIPLIDRSNFANQKGADIFVSIPANAATNPAANGIETFYFAAQGVRNNTSIHHGFDSTFLTQNLAESRAQDSRLLAEKIQYRLVERLQLTDRGGKQGNFSVIRETNMAAVLTELGFMTNANDLALLVSDFGRTKAAEGIYLGI